MFSQFNPNGCSDYFNNQWGFDYSSWSPRWGGPHGFHSHPPFRPPPGHYSHGPSPPEEPDPDIPKSPDSPRRHTRSSHRSGRGGHRGGHHGRHGHAHAPSHSHCHSHFPFWHPRIEPENPNDCSCHGSKEFQVSRSNAWCNENPSIPLNIYENETTITIIASAGGITNGDKVQVGYETSPERKLTITVDGTDDERNMENWYLTNQSRQKLLVVFVLPLHVLNLTMNILKLI